MLFSETRQQNLDSEEQCFAWPKQGIGSEIFQNPLGCLWTHNPTRSFLHVSQIAP